MYSHKENVHGWKGLIQIFFALFFLLIQTGSLKAQNKVKKEELPKVVVKAIERDFTCKEDIKWYASDRTANLDYYMVKSSGDNVTCEATYDKKGQLLNAKTIMKNVRLPDTVQDAINREYAGWTIAGTQAVVQDFRENSKYYKVGLGNEGTYKVVYYNPKGKKFTPRGTPEAGTVEVVKDELPETVVNTIENDFFGCKDKISWRLDDKKTTADRYVAKAEGDKMSCEAVYDKDGNLVSSKTTLLDIKIPQPILQVLVKEYPGWRITGDKAVISDFDSSTGYYEIYLAKGEESKTVYYDATGKKVEPRVS